MLFIMIRLCGFSRLFIFFELLFFRYEFVLFFGDYCYVDFVF